MDVFKFLPSNYKSTMEKLTQALVELLNQEHKSTDISKFVQLFADRVCEISLDSTQNTDALMSAIQSFANSLPDMQAFELHDTMPSGKEETVQKPHQMFWNLITLISFLLTVYSTIAGMDSGDIDRLSAQNAELIEQGNELLNCQQEILDRQQDLIETVKLLAENVELLCEQIEGFNNPSGCEDDPAQ